MSAHIPDKSCIELATKIKERLDSGENSFDVIVTRFDLGLDYVKFQNGAVVAIKDIPSNVLITMYPADYILLDRKNSGMVLPSNDLGSVLINMDPQIIKDRILVCQFDIDEKISIIGEPLINDNSNYLGHLIRDGFDKPPNQKSLYEEKSLALANVEIMKFLNIQVGIISKRDIKAGEELFTFFGYSYWENWQESKKIDNAIKARRESLEIITRKFLDEKTPMLDRLDALEIILNNPPYFENITRINEIFETYFIYSCIHDRLKLAEKLRSLGANNILETLTFIYNYPETPKEWVIPFLIKELPLDANFEFL